jgi:hypothetical protein
MMSVASSAAAALVMADGFEGVRVTARRIEKELYNRLDSYTALTASIGRQQSSGVASRRNEQKQLQDEVEALLLKVGAVSAYICSDFSESRYGPVSFSSHFLLP